LSVSMELKGYKLLERKLGPIQAGKFWKALLSAAASDVKDYIAVYPAASIANSPQARRWYERGYGPRWYRADGSTGGSKTSETLGRRWTISANSQRAIVGNNASYARAVQSAKEQAPYHGQRGWRTDEETLKEMRPKIVEKLRRAIDRILSR